MRFLIAGLFCMGLACASLMAQQPLTQTVRGRVVEAETRMPLTGVAVTALDDAGKVVAGALSDSTGAWRLSRVPLGRRSLRFSMISYEPLQMDNVIVSSGKEVVLEIELISSTLSTDEVTIISRRADEALNELAVVSARAFSIDETNRFAGSRGDPARMASNFAGVQGADDSRNDLVIRGNTPQGVLWRIDGINIPNPNHFAIPGTGGGSISILNNKFLANSDFFTGAFPAAYGNGIAGAFDLRMRNGNNERHEFSGQLGLLGTELMAEGPLNRSNGSSYLAMYRYSTLALFKFLGLQLGTDATPRYQDAAFRLNYRLKKGGSLSFWAVGGLSNIDIILSPRTDPNEIDLYTSNQDRDQYFGSTLGVAALTYQKPLSLKTFLKAGLGISYQGVDAHHDQIFRSTDSEGKFVLDSLKPILGYNFRETKYQAYAYINHKLSTRSSLQAGFFADWYDMRYLDSTRIVTRLSATDLRIAPWQIRWNSREGALLLQPYVQYKWRASDRLQMTAGLTSLLWTLNRNSFSPIEPRLGLSYKTGARGKFSAGAGLHSQIQSPYAYFYGRRQEAGQLIAENRHMGLTKSWHFVAGYDYVPGKSTRIKSEVYYQHLFNIPVYVRPSAFSMINAGSGFSRVFPDTVLQNTGTGRNYGVELTVEKSFSGGYYALFTASLFDAKYRGSDGIYRNSTFNGRYAFNALFAKEFTINKKSALNIGGKLTSIGGRWYGPVDSAATVRLLEIVYEDRNFNTQQFRPYLRADARIAYLWNRPRVSHEIAIDLVNFLGIQNILTLTYVPGAPDGRDVRESYQLGFLPIFYYKLDF